MAGNKLLVADDSVTIQKVIRLALAASSAPGSDRHYEIQSVSDGQELLRHLSHFIPDAILIDVSLPQKSAFEIKTAVDRMGPDFAGIRFILLVGSDERIEDSRLRELGFSGVLTKPFEPSHLRQVLSDALTSPPLIAAGSPLQTFDPPRMQPELHDDDEIPVLLETDDRNQPPELPLTEEEDPLPPPPLDFGEADSDELPPALPSAADLLKKKSGAEEDLWNPDEERRLMDATRNIEIRLAAPDLDELEMKAPPLPASPNSVEEDIRKLAATTLRMSGFNDGSEESPLEPPSIFPEKDMPPSPPADDDTGWSVREPSRLTLKPPRPAAPSPSSIQTSPPAMETTSQSVPASPLDEPTVIPLSIEQMEQILERQLKATLQSMAERILPEIATKILKDEIHKMLTSDAP